MRAGRAGRRLSQRHMWLALVVGVILLFTVSPLVAITTASFDAKSYVTFPPTQWSLHWYANLFTQSEFLSAAIFSLWLGVASALIALTVGLPAAYALVRRAGRWSQGLQSLFLSPLIVPKIVFGVAIFIFVVKLNMYGDPISLVLAHAVLSLPFVIVLLSAAFTGTDPALEDAARDLGAGNVRVFRQILLPQIFVPVIISGLFAFLNSFDQLESTIFLTRPGSETLPIAMYDYTLEYQDPTTAALSVITIIFSLAIAAGLAALLRGRSLIRAAASERR
jgi:putative spermidine/putrescine transport system permease protein